MLHFSRLEVVLFEILPPIARLLLACLVELCCLSGLIDDLLLVSRLYSVLVGLACDVLPGSGNVAVIASFGDAIRHDIKLYRQCLTVCVSLLNNDRALRKRIHSRRSNA